MCVCVSVDHQRFSVEDKLFVQVQSVEVEEGVERAWQQQQRSRAMVRASALF